LRTFYEFIFVLFLITILFSCTSQWHNTRTGEIRQSVPTYPECKKKELEYRFDSSCYIQCMDYCRKIYGPKSNCSGACNKECTKPTGRTVLVDDYDCNYAKAKENGWVPK